MSARLVSPWKDFLEELDSLLDEPFVLHCIGGSAVVAEYGLQRSTNDIDYFSLEPCNRAQDFETLAGQGSPLARKHKIYIQRAAVASVSEDYADRVKEIFPGNFKRLRLFVLDPYDLVLSKLSRNIDRDRDDVKHIASKCSLDPEVLRDRYTRELRPIIIGDVKQHDDALEFWIESYFTSPLE